MTSFTDRRLSMVERQIRDRGVGDPRVLEAMRTLPREHFVSDRMKASAYDDAPLPIDEGQTISQPYVVALMVEALEVRSADRVLEVGTGSGYAAAVLSLLAAEVYGVERHQGLAAQARRRLRGLDLRNVEILHGDGSEGWAAHAPYDAILVSAGTPVIPSALVDQLAVGGRMVLPVGGRDRGQELLLVRKLGPGQLTRTSLGKVSFVPLIAAAGSSREGAPGAPLEHGGHGPGGAGPPTGPSAERARP